MVQKGAVPDMGQIDFEFNEIQLDMLEKRLINSFQMDAIISSPDIPSEIKRKIKLTIENVHRPGSVLLKSTIASTDSNFFNKNELGGMFRAQIYLMDKIIAPQSWIMFGRLQEGNQRPIAIFFFPALKIGTYSFKKKEESIENFNPSLN